MQLAATNPPKILVIRHEACTSLGLLGQALSPDHRVHYLNFFQGEQLTDVITDYSHLVVLGGAISAYEADRHSFLHDEFHLIETAMAAEIPTLGICLGAQILAKVLGANVYRGAAGREAGWCEVELLEAASRDRLLRSFPKRFRVFQSHQDTFEIPTGAVRLAQSAQYPNQAFCYGDRIWALQFHLEFDEHVLTDCAAVITQELYDSGIHTTTVSDLLAAAKRHSPAVAPLAHQFMQQFFQLPTLNSQSPNPNS
ncbi:type 1 glutamine amidotransferase [Thermocoleostomius sinensis]|uniref:Type 1 glutamine amidotransferase n=1 Tax=Thermocoleostomius sinensis A174 TaxID=2016057 RepID=A0A9E8ZD04_9CYAN|nr:type 1 glutamine amidotransferase [Thermocoleostomius sinensis]WAL58995.1 type 1 glutamine amidotransferase [Thermocoleostomius sinensis A174]